MKKYIEPKAIYIDLLLEGTINSTSPGTYGEEGDEGEYTKKQGSSDIWNNWGNHTDK